MDQATNRLSHLQAEALDRAQNGQSLTNYPAIYQGFIAKGIAEADIRPRENVFTFAAWKAKGRSVKRGEHGVRVVTFIEATKRVHEDGEEKIVTFRRPWSTVVFHISQTEPDYRTPRRSAWASGHGRYPSVDPSNRDDHIRDPGEDAADRWNELHSDRYAD
jgi:hypothetical protein